LYIPYENWRFPNWLKSHLSLVPPFINIMYVTTWPISKRGNKWEILSYEAWTDGRTTVCHNKPVFWRAYKNEWNSEITNISFLAKLFFKTFISLKHLSDYRTVGPSDYRIVGLSDCRIIATAPLILTFHGKTKKKTRLTCDYLRFPLLIA
jgi:hypothetical protein